MYGIVLVLLLQAFSHSAIILAQKFDALDHTQKGQRKGAGF